MKVDIDAPRAHDCREVLKLTVVQKKGTCQHSAGPAHDSVQLTKNVSQHLPPFGVVGLSYKTADLELRSQVALTAERRIEFLRRAREAGWQECIAVSTCNRIEIYFAGVEPAGVLAFLAEFTGVPQEILEHHTYVRSCFCASCHLFRVVAGLDSAVLGETEIVAQVREAWATSQDEGMAGPMLNLLLRRAMETSKRIRTETKLCKSVISTAGLAAQRAHQELGNLSEKTAVILGAGKIAERLAKELAPARIGKKIVVNRSRDKAAALARLIAADPRSLDDLEVSIAEADVVFGAVGADQPVVDLVSLQKIMASRPNRPLLLIDLGVPPNVESGQLPDGVTWVGLEELSAASSANAGERQDAVEPSLDILGDELKRFGEALVERAASPTVAALMNLGNHIRSKNLDWLKDKLPELDERQIRVIEEMARRTVLGLLESPIQNLKSDVTWTERRSLIEELFSIG